MKKIVLLLAALIMVSTNGFTEEMKHEMKVTSAKKMPTRFQAVSPDKAMILQEGENKMYCPKCGMTLPMFYKTNHAAHVDGKSEQYCSIHCLAETIADGGKVTGIKVVDNTTLEFIDVINSWYVVGSSKPGTMTMTSKYAFGKKGDAEKFAKEFGGKVMTFYAVLDSVKSTLAQESAMVQKKQAMMAQKGGMMYQEMCTPVDANFTSTAEAKSYLTTQKPCGEIKGSQLQAIGLYLNSRNK
ncbi:nitrous oxide reductase accessory protein NosL [Sulfurovum sp.]|uniref:nitrous oxide reductase accessory protein NosL n=1 Tax=Sulfurovum sp. TaxID=1969726 RepID=UPI003567ED7F